jgi:hypothetical protein
MPKRSPDQRSREEDKAMRVDVSTSLNCSAAKAWDEVQTSALLLRVIWPLARIVPVGAPSFPERWSEGETVLCSSFIFGFIPIGVRSLYFKRIDEAAGVRETRESDPLVKRWDHRVTIRPDGADRSVYRDEIDIDAGPWTFLVWAWASWFYRHRQARLRKITKTL